jgi:hypothetical protein
VCQRSWTEPTSGFCSPNEERGYNLFVNINYVNSLVTDWRHKDDVVFGDMLKRLRMGELTDADRRLLNASCFVNERIPDMQISDYANLNNHYCPILTTSNKVRASLQNKQLYVYCATAGTPMVIYYPIVKKPHRRGQTTDFSPKELYDFRSFSDDKTSRLPFNGHLAIGMPVMITQNMFPKIKVMNGTIGFIVSIQHDGENLMTITYGTEANNYIQKHECLRSPKVVFIKL